MKIIILLMVVVLFPVHTFSETVSTETSSSSQTLKEDTNKPAQFSPDLNKDVIIYRTGEGVDLQNADVCNQCTDQEISSESSNTSH